MGNPVLLIAAFCAAITAQQTLAVDYQVINNAKQTAGGGRFEHQIGVGYSRQVLANASSFIWAIFNQTTSQRKDVKLVTLQINSMNGVAQTADDRISISAQYINSYVGNVKEEITGILYHETTHIWQWNGKGKAPSGLIEGIADYVRLKAGYAPSHWVAAGGGQRWDQGYDVTARFLDYCSTHWDTHFVAKLNALLKDSYDVNFFQRLLNQSVDRLWARYKAAYRR